MVSWLRQIPRTYRIQFGQISPQDVRVLVEEGEVIPEAVGEAGKVAAVAVVETVAWEAAGSPNLPDKTLTLLQFDNFIAHQDSFRIVRLWCVDQQERMHAF